MSPCIPKWIFRLVYAAVVPQPWFSWRRSLSAVEVSLNIVACANIRCCWWWTTERKKNSIRGFYLHIYMYYTRWIGRLLRSRLMYVYPDTQTHAQNRLEPIHCSWLCELRKQNRIRVLDVGVIIALPVDSPYGSFSALFVVWALTAFKTIYLIGYKRNKKIYENRRENFEK